MKSQNQKTEKPKNSLPIKTKIAIWLLMALGMLMVIFLFIDMLKAEELAILGVGYLIIMISPLINFLFIAGVLLLTKNKTCRKISIALIIFMLVLYLIEFKILDILDKKIFFVSFTILFLALVLILTDAKNFYEVSK